MLQMNFILIPYFDWLLGPLKGQIFEKKKKSLKIFSSETVCYMKLILCTHVPGISLYKDFFFFRSSQIRTLVAMATFSLQRLIRDFDSIKQRLLDTYKQSWYSAINNSNRLETYARFKHEFEIETYLDFIKENKYKIALTQFRLSSHNLAIERGRIEHIDRSERVYKLCNSNVIENEFHFLLVCPLYRELRKQYLKPYFCRWPTLNKFDSLMLNMNKKSLLNVAKFIYHAMILRQSSIS